VAPNLTVAPSYVVEIGLHPTDFADITDIATPSSCFMVATISAACFDPPPPKK
jgi:hypothetical protein